MFKKVINYIGILFIILTLFALANLTSDMFVNGVLTYVTATDSTIAVNLDTANALTRSYIIRLGDSAAANRAGATVREEVWFEGFANFSNNTNDSTTFQLNGNVFNTHPLLYNMYLDRIVIRSNKSAALTVTTFRDDLPILTTDSVLIFMLSRNNSFSSGLQGGITVYKVPSGNGLTQVGTGATFYDMIRFNESVFKTVSNATQVQVYGSFKKKR